MALVVLRRYAMLSEAHAAAAALRSAGLYPVMLDEAVAPPYSGLPAMGGFRLAVSEEEAEAAAAVLREALGHPVDGAQAWPEDAWEDAWEDDGPAEGEGGSGAIRAARPVAKAFAGLYLLLLLGPVALGLGALVVTGLVRAVRGLFGI